MRLIRAIEVFELTGRRLSQFQEEHGFRRAELDIAMLGLNMARPALYARIDSRCRTMVESGLVDEVRGLRQRGFDARLPALRSIGYREIGRYLDGRCDLDRAVAAMAQATRRFAKRQLTWFRADPTVCWLDAAETDAATALRALNLEAIRSK
jgi:tRNA dimethylallyltransferase